MTKEDKKKRLIIWLSIVLVILIVICVVLWIFHPFSNHAGNQSTPSPSATATASPTVSADSTMSVSCKEYQVYALDDTDFGFVIAKVHVQSQNAITLSLGSFKTGDGIQLNQVSSYINTLKDKGYTLDGEKIADAIVSSSDKEMDINVFIPYTNKEATALEVSTNFNTEKLSFNLYNADHTGTALKKSTPAPTPEERTLQVAVDSCIEIDAEKLLTSNDEVLFLPSTARVFSIHANVTAPSDQSVTITSATLDVDGYGSVTAEDSDTHVNGEMNLVNLEVSAYGNGYIYVILLDPGHTITSFNGTLNLEMADTSQNTSLPVSWK